MRLGPVRRACGRLTPPVASRPLSVASAADAGIRPDEAARGSPKPSGSTYESPGACSGGSRGGRGRGAGRRARPGLVARGLKRHAPVVSRSDAPRPAGQPRLSRCDHGRRRLGSERTRPRGRPKPRSPAPASPSRSAGTRPGRRSQRPGRPRVAGLSPRARPRRLRRARSCGASRRASAQTLSSGHRSPYSVTTCRDPGHRSSSRRTRTGANMTLWRAFTR